MLLHIEDTFNYPSVICLVPEMVKKPDCAAQDSNSRCSDGYWISHPFWAASILNTDFRKLPKQFLFKATTATETSRTWDIQKNICQQPFLIKIRLLIFLNSLRREAKIKLYGDRTKRTFEIYCTQHKI